jgi:hypothetical protein
LFSFIPFGNQAIGGVARFFAGFCLVANGAYIAIGSFDGVGDCGEMLRTGTPIWLMLFFGGVTIPAGFYLWHRLGSAREFFANPTLITQRMLLTTVAALAVVIVAELILSPR